jgi:hypothetical protein
MEACCTLPYFDLNSAGKPEEHERLHRCKENQICAYQMADLGK